MGKSVLNKRIGNFSLVISETYEKLEDYKNQENREAFNRELLRIMPHVQQYVSKRLKAAIVAGKLNKGMFKPSDFTDQLFIEVYENWNQIKAENDLRPFVFKKVDELLDDSLTEEEFDHIFFENIDNYTQQEWNAMEENFSADGDGDLVMLEELDEVDSNMDNQTLNHVFVTEEEKELAEKLDKSLDKERVERHINMVLGKMSLPLRSVFQLYSDQGFSPEEIASIRKTTLVEVEDMLLRARKLLKKSFIKRFLIDSN